MLSAPILCYTVATDIEICSKRPSVFLLDMQRVGDTDLWLSILPYSSIPCGYRGYQNSFFGRNYYVWGVVEVKCLLLGWNLVAANKPGEVVHELQQWTQSVFKLQ